LAERNRKEKSRWVKTKTTIKKKKAPVLPRHGKGGGREEEGVGKENSANGKGGRASSP